MTDIATTPAIERQLDLRASPDRVWRALTVADELAAWFGQRADLQPMAGYAGWLAWEGDGRYALRVEEVVAPTRLAIRWMAVPDVPFDDASATLVEWDLEPSASGGTRLHLRESGFRSASSRTGNAIGWLGELGELVAFLADERWQAGIRRTYHLRSGIDEVWAAFADPERFSAWWGGTDPVELRAGAVGWWEWPSEGGRFAVRIEAVEPPTYLSWTWTPVPEVGLDEASELLHTEWALEARDDGGTDLHLLETGFADPEDYRLNDAGWDSDVIPALRRVLGEPGS